MPTNQQRREAAKRKLQRQLVRREEMRARRRRTTIIVGSVAVLLVAAGVVLAITASKKESDSASNTDSSASTPSSPPTSATSSSGPVTPCTYTAAGKAAKAVKLPSNTSPGQTGSVAVKMTLNGQAVDVTLDRALAPCSVNSFLSLASQGFYNDTSCLRLTASGALNVLQCGDPSGKGNGGPGYSYPATAPTTTNAYKVGTLAMANVASAATGAAEEGSQFFIVYGNTKIASSYSVIGSVSAAGMKVVDAIASQGVKNDLQDGAPKAAAKLGTLTVPEVAVTSSTVWTTASSADANAGLNDSTGAVPSATGSLQPSQTPSSAADGTPGSAVSTGSTTSVVQRTTN